MPFLVVMPRAVPLVIEPLEIDTTVPVAWIAYLAVRGTTSIGTPVTDPDPGPLPVTNYATSWGMDAAFRDEALAAVLNAGTLSGHSLALSCWSEISLPRHEFGTQPNEGSGNGRLDPDWTAPFSTIVTISGVDQLVWASRSSTQLDWVLQNTPGQAIGVDGFGAYRDGSTLFALADLSGPSTSNPIYVRVWAENFQLNLIGGDMDQVVNAWARGTSYTGSSTLHLGLLDPTGAEPSGGWYSRQAVTFAAVVSHATSQNEDISWTTGSTFTLDRLGVWSAASGGRLIQAWDPFGGFGARLVPAGTLITVFAGALHAHS